MSGKVDEVIRHFDHWRSLGIEVDDLFDIPTDLNPADILTRGDVKLEQLQSILHLISWIGHYYSIGLLLSLMRDLLVSKGHYITLDA